MFVAMPSMFALVASLVISVPSTAPVPATSGTQKAVVNELVTGRIVSLAGHGMDDARVSVYFNGATEASSAVRTDYNGSYSFNVPSTVNFFTVRVIRIGYAPVTVQVTRQSSGWDLPAKLSMRPLPLDGWMSAAQ